MYFEKLTSLNKEDTLLDLIFKLTYHHFKSEEIDRIRNLELESWLINSSGELNSIGLIWLSFENLSGKEEKSVSLVIRPSYQKRGYGLKVIKKFTDYFFSISTEQKLIALIHRKNIHSQNVFKAAGYKLREVDDFTAGSQFDVYEIFKKS